MVVIAGWTLRCLLLIEIRHFLTIHLPHDCLPAQRRQINSNLFLFHFGEAGESASGNRARTWNSWNGRNVALDLRDNPIIDIAQLGLHIRDKILLFLFKEVPLVFDGCEARGLASFLYLEILRILI